MAVGNQPAVGDKVHHENRRHPTKAGWLQANGVIIGIVNNNENDDHPDFEDLQEVLVEFGEDDTELYSFTELEWTNMLGGYWRVV